MVVGCFTIVPLIVGLIALNKLESATKREELTTMGILALFFCGLIPGILMLCMKDSDLVENQ